MSELDRDTLKWCMEHAHSKAAGFMAKAEVFEAEGLDVGRYVYETAANALNSIAQDFSAEITETYGE